MNKRLILPMVLGLALLLGISGLFLPSLVTAVTEKPTLIAEDFYRHIRSRRYEEAAELLSQQDKRNFRRVKNKMTQSGQNGSGLSLGKLIKDQFFLVEGQRNKNEKLIKKSGDGETILPEKVSFFVPGQYYVVGNFAVVFTRETYTINQEQTGPVRDDPRKLWIDPTNDLSKIRDEAYFKRWWVWDGNQLTMPGIIWMIKENREWRIDLLSGQVPKKAFRGLLKWHFGRDIFVENESQASNNVRSKQPANKPAGKNQ